LILQKNKALSITLLVASLLVLSGCSVSPQLISVQDRENRKNEDLKKLFSAKYNETQRFTLDEAIAHALKYNMEQQVRLADIDLAYNVNELSHYEQLPQLTAGTNHVSRDPQPKADLDESQNSANLSMVWNVLDFGVSYVKARQDSDRYLIAKEKQRLIANRIIKDTRRYFWRSLAADQLKTALTPLEKKLNVAIKNAKIAEMRGLQSPMESLAFQKTLLEILSQLKNLQKSLMTDKINLAKMMNISPSSEFELVMPKGHEVVLERKLLLIKVLEDYALVYRPELYEEDYKSRIQADEARKAMLRMLPGLELDLSRKYDDGDLYENNVWSEAGLRLTWNIMNLFSAPKQLDLQESRKALQELKRLSMSMTVLTQVNIAHVRYLHQLSHYQLSERMSDVNHRLLKHADAGHMANELTEMELIRHEADAAVSEIKKQLAYAELQDANAEMMMSVGAVLLPENYIKLPVEELARKVREYYNSWIDNHMLHKLKVDDEGWVVVKEKAES